MSEKLWHDGLPGDTVIYIGERDPRGYVKVRRGDGRLIGTRLDIRNHSPTGFEWGYGGSGPAQLALAMLTDFHQDDELAIQYYQAWKFLVVAALPRDGWAITKDEFVVKWRQLLGQETEKNQAGPQ